MKIFKPLERTSANKVLKLMLYNCLRRLFLIAFSAISMNVYALERVGLSEVPLPDAKRCRSTIPIHTEFTTEERSEARRANITSPLFRLPIDLLWSLMHKDPKIQLMFFQACKWLNMQVQDTNSPEREGGALVAHYIVLLHDEQFCPEKDKENRKQHRSRLDPRPKHYRKGLKLISTSDSDFSLTSSYFGLRNIDIVLYTCYDCLTPGAVVVFQKLLAANPAIYGIDYSRVNNNSFSNFRVDELHNLFRTDMCPKNVETLTQIRRLGVGKYISLCANNNLYSFYPHPSQLTNLEELLIGDQLIDNLTVELYGWLGRLPKLWKLNVAQNTEETYEDEQGAILMPFNGFTALRLLNINDVDVSLPFLQSLSSLRSMQTFKLNSDPRTKVRDVPITLEHLAGLPLRQLQIDVRFQHTTLPTLPFLTTLTKLKLIDMGGVSIKSLTRFPNLLHLSMEGSNNYEEVAMLSSLKSLVLDFKFSQGHLIDGETLGSFRNFKCITALLQLETILFRDSLRAATFTTIDTTRPKCCRFYISPEMMDPQIYNALPKLTDLVFDIHIGYTADCDYTAVLPIRSNELNPSISVTNRRGSIEYKADETFN